jgi:hypothetical protein
MRSIAFVLASLSLAAVVGCGSSSSSTTTSTDAGTIVRPDAGSTDAGTGGGGGGGTTATDCGGIVSCLNGCGQNDQACGQTCVSGGTAAAQSQFGALNTCLSQKCASAQSDAAFQQCATTQCASEVNACEGLGGGGGGGGGGAGTCAELAQCLNGCSSASDQACIQNCASQASPAAVQAYQAVGTCAQQNGCTNAQTQQQCLQQNCSAEVNACLSN